MKRKMAMAVVYMSAVLVSGVLYAACGSCGTVKADEAKKGCKLGSDKAAECGAKEQKACASHPSCAKGTAAAASQEPAKISTEALKALLKSGAATVLDARSGKWDDGSRIPGAKALSPDATAEEIAKAIPSKDALVVTYCSNTKCPASHKLASKLADLGYQSILEYPEGIQGWKDAGHSVE